MLLDIVKYGSPVLRECAIPVPSVTPALVRLAADMVDTMHKARGVGLAAEQVGRLEALCVIDVPPDCEDDVEVREFNAPVRMPLVMFNPVVIAAEGEQDGKEGCLSLPNMSAKLVRADKVTCQFVDETGRMQVITVRGFLARAVQHETDHLKGVLYVDKLDDAAKASMSKRLQKLAGRNGGVL